MKEVGLAHWGEGWLLRQKKERKKVNNECLLEE
jgi:hypothetical protein